MIAAALIAVSATLRGMINVPWAQVLGAAVPVATVFVGGLGSLAIQKRRRLAQLAKE